MFKSKETRPEKQPDEGHPIRKVYSAVLFSNQKHAHSKGGEGKQDSLTEKRELLSYDIIEPIIDLNKQIPNHPRVAWGSEREPDMAPSNRISPRASNKNYATDMAAHSESRSVKTPLKYMSQGDGIDENNTGLNGIESNSANKLHHPLLGSLMGEKETAFNDNYSPAATPDMKTPTHLFIASSLLPEYYYSKGKHYTAESNQKDLLNEQPPFSKNPAILPFQHNFLRCQSFPIQNARICEQESNNSNLGRYEFSDTSSESDELLSSQDNNDDVVHFYGSINS